MMRVRGPLAIAVVTLLVLCTADPRQEQDVRVGEQSGDRYMPTDLRQNEELESFLRFLMQYENAIDERNMGRIGGSTLLGRNAESYQSNVPGRLGGSSMIGRDVGYGYNNLNRISGSSLLGRSLIEKRFLDPLGGGNFVRNLDSIGGGNFVKKNLDQIGGPNLVKRNLDSLGGGNLVRNLDSIGGGNFVRHVDPLGGHKPRNLDPLGGGNLVREVRESRRPYYMGRRYEYGSAYGGKRDPWLFASPIDYGYYGDVPKRNFDEIDRSNLDNFVKKRNFDGIDQTSMPFPFKRFYHLFGSNYLDTPVSSFDKKRYRPDYPMDEIDLSPFPIGSKRSVYSARHPLRPSL